MTRNQVETLELKIGELQQHIEKISVKQKGIFSALWTGFQNDEKLLIKLMNAFPPNNGPYPSPNDPGNVEYGWALYFLNVKLPETGSLGKWLQHFLSNDLDMPPTTITANDWSEWYKVWSSSGVVMGDGSLVATQQYAVMDLGWSLALLDFIKLQIGWETKADFNDNPNTITIDTSSQPTLNIAIMGDWGAGNYKDGPSPNSPAIQVMDAINAKAPDMVVHLGDVYYAGTSSEEQENLLNSWTYDAPLGNFTLNSNHEMYDGGQSYFNIALTSSLISKYQTGQKNEKPASYFSIEYGDYLIVGLDSAYNATGMYMDGRITDSGQLKFINDAAKKGKKLILMTHHNPMETYGSATNGLWEDVVMNKKALNNAAPFMWYWGHIHNGIVYSDRAVTGSVLARCLGNGSIPIGTAPWLQNNSSVSYFTNTPLNDGTKNNQLRVKNGFAILTIDSNGITETWYDQSGNVCWSNQTS